MDMMQFTVPKSDQLNADDLIGGPRTVTITRVAGTGNPDQPVAVGYEGDDGRPYKPCKSMRRVMVHCWGADASQYVGRSMTLVRDPEVMFGGMKVGGIRISHMSHIERDQVLALTATKGKRTGYSVRVLEVSRPAAPAEPRQTPEDWARGVIAEFERATSRRDVLATVDATLKGRAALLKRSPELHAEVEAARQAAVERTEDAA
jgi:hypothetical protein